MDNADRLAAVFVATPSLRAQFFQQPYAVNWQALGTLKYWDDKPRPSAWPPWFWYLSLRYRKQRADLAKEAFDRITDDVAHHKLTASINTRCGKSCLETEHIATPKIFARRLACTTPGSKSSPVFERATPGRPAPMAARRRSRSSPTAPRAVIRPLHTSKQPRQHQERQPRELRALLVIDHLGSQIILVATEWCASENHVYL